MLLRFCGFIFEKPFLKTVRWFWKPTLGLGCWYPGRTCWLDGGSGRFCWSGVSECDWGCEVAPALAILCASWGEAEEITGSLMSQSSWWEVCPVRV